MQKTENLSLKNLDAQLDTTSGKHGRYLEELRAHAEDARSSHVLGSSAILTEAFSVYAQETRTHLFIQLIIIASAVFFLSSVAISLFNTHNIDTQRALIMLPGWILSIPILLPGGLISSLLPEPLFSQVAPILFFISPVFTTLFWSSLFFMLHSNPKRRPQMKKLSESSS